MKKRTTWIALAALIAALSVAGAIRLGRSATVDAQALPQVTPQRAEITTDQNQYTIGQAVQICYATPGPGTYSITDLRPDGTSPVIYSGDTTGARTCTTATASAPTGRECLRLDYSGNFGSGSRQTCFLVVGSTPPPPFERPQIWTNASQYQVGSPITFCWSVPGPGSITITDILANGVQQVLVSEFDNGQGGCMPGTITPPIGTECLRLDYTIPGGGDSTDTCFQVLGLTDGSGSVVAPGFPEPPRTDTE